jgi:glycerol-3-phosphate acyltransferase PlsY
MLNIFWLAFSYVLGSIPFGLVVGKFMCGKDPREDGSRNTGATNVARTCGTKYGVLVLVLDALKGFTPVIVALNISDSAFYHGLVVLAPIVGHMFSIFLRGRGGKGVSTTIGAFLALSPWVLLVSLLLCGIVIAVSGYVSLGSLTLAAAVPLLLLLSGDVIYFLSGVVVMALIYAKHRENIARLARGEEKPWRKKDDAGETGAGH